MGQNDPSPRQQGFVLKPCAGPGSLSGQGGAELSAREAKRKAADAADREASRLRLEQRAAEDRQHNAERLIREVVERKASEARASAARTRAKG